MRRLIVVQLALLATLGAACATVPRGPASAGASSLVGTAAASVGPSISPPLRALLPPGFPVLPGAVAVALPNDDAGLISMWTSDRPGSAAYDFYAAALPGAGYPIVGLYPGGAAAVIRFSLPDGTIWQVVTHPAPDAPVAIEVRLDRP